MRGPERQRRAGRPSAAGALQLGRPDRPERAATTRQVGGWYTWAHRVRVDLAALRPYAGAVYAATDDYLASLPADLASRTDDALLPQNDAASTCLLTAILLTVVTRRGEIACLRSFVTP